MSLPSTGVDSSGTARSAPPRHPHLRGARPGEEVGLRVPPDWRVAEADTFGPFYTRIVYVLPDGSEWVWSSWRHRMGCGLRRPARVLADAGHGISPVSALWRPSRLSWWMAAGYLVGCLVFLATQSLQLAGVLTRPGVEWGYLAASAVFVVANYCGLVSALNADDDLTDRPPPLNRHRWLGWRSDRIGYLVSFVLLCGSSLFVLEALARVLFSGRWSGSGWLATIFGVVGSVGFLAATAVQVREVRVRSLWWEPWNLGWWRSVLSFLGCVGFVLGAAASLTSDWLPRAVGEVGTEVMFLVGIGLFLLGSYLIFPELARE